MDILNKLPDDIQNKIKYMTLEHPIAKIHKHHIKVDTVEQNGKTLIYLSSRQNLFLTITRFTRQALAFSVIVMVL